MATKKREKEIERVEIPEGETVVLYCYECDTIDMMREMHPGHRVLLVSLTESTEEQLERAKQLARQYFINKQEDRRNRGPFAGRYAVPQ